ncbi:Bromodomain and PHD finger-containing protein 3 [Sesbania bispinosa]|nr:Bromodomain and PHD finger-containing protein 3 [Sesbania bispinosa]
MTRKGKDSDEFFAEPMNPDVRDVYLICFNAMTAFPSNSRYYKAAEDVNSHARRFFENFGPALSNFELELFLNKKRQSRKDGKVGTSEVARASPKPAGRSNATHPKAPRTQRRDTYLNPSNKPLVSEFLTANKPNIQLNIDPSNYKDSLLAFVEDLGPTAKKVAEKKLEALKFHQPLSGDTPIPNIGKMVSPHENMFGNTSQWSTLASKPDRLTQVHPTYVIPGTQLKTLESIPGNSFSVSTLTLNRSKEIMPNINLSGPSFMPQRRTIETMPGINLSRSSLLQQIRPEQTMPGNNLSGPSSFMQQRRPEETMPGINLSGPSSFMQQRRHEETMHEINLSGPSSFMQQRRPEEIMHRINLSGPSTFMTQIRAGQETMSGFDLSGPSFMPQIRAKEIMGPSINPSSSSISLMSQPRPQDSMSGMNPSNTSFWSLLNEGQSIPNKNFSGLTILPPKPAKYSNEPETSLFNSGASLQPGGFQALLGTSDLNNSPYPNQELIQNAFNPVPLQEPMPSTAPGMPLAGTMNYNGEGAIAGGQPEEEASLQLLWDNEEPPPNLSLQL